MCPEGSKGRHVCAQWMCVVRVHGHTGECVWRAWGGRRLGLPSQASRGPVPRGREGADSAQELLHHPITCLAQTPDK